MIDDPTTHAQAYMGPAGRFYAHRRTSPERVAEAGVSMTAR